LHLGRCTCRALAGHHRGPDGLDCWAPHTTQSASSTGFRPSPPQVAKPTPEDAALPYGIDHAPLPSSIPSLSPEVYPPQRRFITEKGIAAAKQVDALPNRLESDVVAELRSILSDSGEGALLRNNVANKLRQCGDGRLVADLTRMAWDKRETPKWRNYCIQHLYSAFENSRDPAILGTLFEAADPDRTDEKEVRICAVWSLARAATPRDKREAPDDETLGKIRAAALDALREKDAHFLVTTAGVQSCGRLKLKDALPDIRKLAGDEDTEPAHLRVVSLAALGDLGDDTDLPLLDRLAKSAKGQLKSAAALAAKKIRKRAAEADKTDGASIKSQAPDGGRPSF
jgi:HEAT repeat protein